MLTTALHRPHTVLVVTYLSLNIYSTEAVATIPFRVQLGSNVLLRCSDSQNSVKRWNYDNSMIFLNHNRILDKINFTNLYLSRGYTLNIKRVSLENEGTYTCLVDNVKTKSTLILVQGK